MAATLQLEVSERQRRAVLTLLTIVVFISVTSGTMINVALPFIGRYFGVGEPVYGWIVTGFTLSFAIFSAVHGRLADVYGARRLYVAGVGLFGVTAVFVTFAPTIELAIAFRLLQGVGAAALPALGTIIISRIFPPNRRGGAMGVIIGTTGVAASIGPFLGGVLLDLFGWRSVFLFSALNLLALPTALKLFPRDLDQTQPQTFDRLGALLLGFGAAALMYSFNVLESAGLSAELGAIIGLALASTIGFVLWVRRHPEPFVSPRLFADGRYVAALVTASLINATRFGTLVLVPILLVEVERASGLVIGTVLLPGALLIGVVSPGAGRWGDRVGARRPVVWGTLWVAVGVLIMAVTSGLSILGIAVGMSLYGLGFSFIQSPTIGAISQILPESETGVGLGMFMMIYFLGGALGVAFTVNVVAIQGADVASWLGLEQGSAAPFANALVSMLGLVALAALFLQKLPDADPRPMPELERDGEPISG